MNTHTAREVALVHKLRNHPVGTNPRRVFRDEVGDYDTLHRRRTQRLHRLLRYRQAVFVFSFLLLFRGRQIGFGQRFESLSPRFDAIVRLLQSLEKTASAVGSRRIREQNSHPEQ